MDSTVTVKLYADDANLYSYIQCAEDMHYLQLGLDFVYNWFIVWQLSLSVNKCTMLCLSRPIGTGSYTINNSNLPMCRIIWDLSILINCDSNFKEHISASANQHVFLIRNYFLSKDITSLVKAFNPLDARRRYTDFAQTSIRAGLRYTVRTACYHTRRKTVYLRYGIVDPRWRTVYNLCFLMHTGPSIPES